jgi:hypothetical protein
MLSQTVCPAIPEGFDSPIISAVKTVAEKADGENRRTVNKTKIAISKRRDFFIDEPSSKAQLTCPHRHIINKTSNFLCLSDASLKVVV